MAYRTNYTSKYHISLSDLDNMIKELEEKQKSYETVLTNVANRVADEMQKEVLSSKYNGKNGGNPYASTQKEVIPGKTKATAKITNHDAKALFYEMGTGVVGSSNPTVSEYIRKFGWVYDHKDHGDDGWVYPKDDGTFGRTRGLVAMKGFYHATLLISFEIKDITLEELKKV